MDWVFFIWPKHMYLKNIFLILTETYVVDTLTKRLIDTVL